jgi:ferredoxin
MVQASSGSYKVTFKTPEGDKTVDCSVNQFILDAGLEAGIDLPYKCKQGQCTTCTAKIIDGVLDQDLVKNIGEDTRKNYSLICCSYPVSDCTLETNAEMPEEGPALYPSAH